MTKYVKKLNETQLETLSNDKALNYLDTEELNAQGYKEFIPATKEQGKPYKYSYEETETQIIEHAEEIIPDPIDVLKSAKEQKKQENATVRDEKLIAGVEYKGVLFDSDTDQKINLSSQISFMDDIETVKWYGMDSVSYVECTKEDLLNIGGLIKELTTFVWTHNSEIITEIENAETVEEVESIVINYDLLKE